MAGEDDTNLVSTVTVEGGDVATAKLKDFGDKGAEAFTKVGKAAEDAGKKVDKSTDDMAKGADDAGDALKKLGDVDPVGESPARLKEAAEAGKEFGKAIKDAAKDISTFVAKVAGIGLAAGTAATALGASAGKIVDSLQKQNDGYAKLIKGQEGANNSMLKNEVASINYGSSLKQLRTEFNRGNISYEEFSKAQTKLRDNFEEQRRVAKEVAAATKEVEEANARLQKQVADRKVFTDLIDTYGGPLLTSLLTLGRAFNSVKEDFKTAFSPAAASVVDVLGAAFDRNSGRLSAFFDSASQLVQKFVQQNGSEIGRALDSLAGAFISIGEGLVAAGPQVLRVFNDVIVPAVKGVVSVVQGAVKVFNDLFGTNVSIGALLFAAALFKVTGAFKALVGVINLARTGLNILSFAAGGPLLIGIGLAIAALIVLYNVVDWKALTARVIEFATSTQKYFSDLVTKVSGFFKSLFSGASDSASSASQFVVDAWNGVVTFFTVTLPTAIGGAFTAMWDLIVSSATAAIDGVVAAFNGFVAFVSQSIVQPIRQFFADAWQYVSDRFSDAVTYITDTFNSLVEFFTEIPATLQSIWDAVKTSIQNAFKAGLDYVTGLFTSFVASIKEKLQPIVDLIKSLGSSIAALAGGGGGDNTVRAAGGGHVRGAGTSTSDSIPAWLSNNEFVVKAKAVRKYGVSLMHAINSGRFDFGRIARFAQGGLVGASPQVSLAGLDVSGGRGGGNTLNLSLFGEEFQGLQADDDVARRLSRLSVERQTRAAGRAPKWAGRQR